MLEQQKIQIKNFFIRNGSGAQRLRLFKFMGRISEFAFFVALTKNFGDSASLAGRVSQVKQK